jgi:hypothetical protein
MPTLLPVFKAALQGRGSCIHRRLSETSTREVLGMHESDAASNSSSAEEKSFPRAVVFKGRYIVDALFLDRARRQLASEAAAKAESRVSALQAVGAAAESDIKCNSPCMHPIDEVTVQRWARLLGIAPLLPEQSAPHGLGGQLTGDSANCTFGLRAWDVKRKHEVFLRVNTHQVEHERENNIFRSLPGYTPELLDLFVVCLHSMPLRQPPGTTPLFVAPLSGVTSAMPFPAAARAFDAEYDSETASVTTAETNSPTLRAMSSPYLSPSMKPKNQKFPSYAPDFSLRVSSESAGVASTSSDQSGGHHTLALQSPCVWSPVSIQTQSELENCISAHHTQYLPEPLHSWYASMHNSASTGPTAQPDSNSNTDRDIGERYLSQTSLSQYISTLCFVSVLECADDCSSLQSVTGSNNWRHESTAKASEPQHNAVRAAFQIIECVRRLHYLGFVHTALNPSKFARFTPNQKLPQVKCLFRQESAALLFSEGAHDEETSEVVSSFAAMYETAEQHDSEQTQNLCEWKLLSASSSAPPGQALKFSHFLRHDPVYASPEVSLTQLCANARWGIGPGLSLGAWQAICRTPLFDRQAPSRDFLEHVESAKQSMAESPQATILLPPVEATIHISCQSDDVFSLGLILLRIFSGNDPQWAAAACQGLLDATIPVAPLSQRVAAQCLGEMRSLSPSSDLAIMAVRCRAALRCIGPAAAAHSSPSQLHLRLPGDSIPSFPLHVAFTDNYVYCDFLARCIVMRAWRIEHITKLHQDSCLLPVGPQIEGLGEKVLHLLRPLLSPETGTRSTEKLTDAISEPLFNVKLAAMRLALKQCKVLAIVSSPTETAVQSRRLQEMAPFVGHIVNSHSGHTNSTLAAKHTRPHSVSRTQGQAELDKFVLTNQYAELQLLQSVFTDGVANVCRIASWKVLQENLSKMQPQIVQFSGHGGAATPFGRAEKSPGSFEGTLYFERHDSRTVGGSRTSHPVSAEDFVHLLQVHNARLLPHQRVQCVVLHACSTLGIAHSLVSALEGLVCIAWHGLVLSDAAVAFSFHFNYELAIQLMLAAKATKYGSARPNRKQNTANSTDVNASTAPEQSKAYISEEMLRRQLPHIEPAVQQHMARLRRGGLSLASNFGHASPALHGHSYLKGAAGALNGMGSLSLGEALGFHSADDPTDCSEKSQPSSRGAQKVPSSLLAEMRLNGYEGELDMYRTAFRVACRGMVDLGYEIGTILPTQPGRTARAQLALKRCKLSEIPTSPLTDFGVRECNIVEPAVHGQPVFLHQGNLSDAAALLSPIGSRSVQSIRKETE